MRNVSLSAVSLISLAAFGLMALGSKSSDKASTSTASPSASDSAATQATQKEGTGAAGAAAGKLPVLARCNIKAIGKCTENYGFVPTMAGEFCKGDEGEFTSGSTPCPTDGLVGTCEFKAKTPGAPGETSFYYANAVGDAKGSCEALGAIWTAKSAPAAPTVPANAGKAPTPTKAAAAAPTTTAKKK